MPPRVASAPGSTGKNRPVCLMYSFSCLRVTPACTTASRSSSCTASTLFIRDRSIDTPPCSARMCPSREVPTPNGIIGTRWRRQMSTTSRTSSVVSTNNTASGRAYGKYDSSLPWCSRTAAEVETRSPSSALSSASAVSKSRGLVLSSFYADLAVERHAHAERGDLEGALYRQRFAALQLARLDRLLHRLLDLALRAHPPHLQELADAEVEGFLVHQCSPLRILFARSLPSSTPHWSKLLMFQTTPWVKTRS